MTLVLTDRIATVNVPNTGNATQKAMAAFAKQVGGVKCAISRVALDSKLRRALSLTILAQATARAIRRNNNASAKQVGLATIVRFLIALASLIATAEAHATMVKPTHLLQNQSARTAPKVIWALLASLCAITVTRCQTLMLSRQELVKTGKSLHDGRQSASAIRASRVSIVTLNALTRVAVVAILTENGAGLTATFQNANLSATMVNACVQRFRTMQSANATTSLSLAAIARR